MAATMNNNVDEALLTEEMEEWQPPSEAEMKIIAARRERSDKISKIMGDYLLKGYKMLGIVCDECSTILMETKAGEKYCITCKELDTDTDKDNPVTNPTAARSQVFEGSRSTLESSSAEDHSVSGRNHSSLTSIPSTFGQPTAPPSTTRAEIHHVDIPPIHQGTLSSSSHSIPATGAIDQIQGDAVDSLCGKLQWASEQLKTETNLQRCTQLCELIKASADAIRSLKDL
ncbi:protein ZNRD2-like [Ylistrum balloti]|uniref:protein ZNRD2-like n=1 Tax=Ylistrum balloti TaxID=509963 RepID=UPI002905973E|nr:protein ZNRD2-like [Ylistrum balloti]